MDVLQVLENGLSPDPSKRQEAELQLKDAATNHFSDYLTLLSNALNNNEAKTEARMLAGLKLKNDFTSKDPKVKEAQIVRWFQLPVEQRQLVKEQALSALLSEVDRVANATAQLVAAIADIELPRNEWSGLIPIMIENTKAEKPVNVKRASLLTIGYICELADPNDPQIIQQLNGILMAIFQGCQALEQLKLVRLTALNALVNSLEFIRFNFEREGERHYIMQVVCEATQADDSDLQAAAFGCLSRIMSLYYRHMCIYMEKALYTLTTSGMQSDDDKVACMAVEFWSSVCEEELDLVMQREEFDAPPAEYQSFNFALVAIQDVLPTLLNLLTRQKDDPEDDDWSVAMAAGACLQLFAQNTGSYVIQPTLLFVSANIGNQTNWKCREAAVMAFGSILDGPDRDQLKVLITQALEPILLLMADEHLQVKETVAWCLGRIADVVVESLTINDHLPQVMQALATGLQDHPKVSTNCCWTLMNVLEQLCSDGADEELTLMSKYYPTLVPLLIQLSNREDNEESSRASAYEALSYFVTYSGRDVMPIVQEIASEVLNRLQQTINIVEQQQVQSVEDLNNMEDVQTNILSLLANIIRRAGSDVQAVSDNIMTMFLKLLEVYSKQPQAASNIEEDVFIGILSVASALGPDFVKYMEAFQPILISRVGDTSHPSCKVAIGTVADLAQSLGTNILPYMEQIMNTLGTNLTNLDIRSELTPAILSCFGDVATSIGINFKPYISFTMNFCKVALELTTEDETINSLDFILNVKEACLDAYVGIIASTTTDPNSIGEYFPQVFLFIQLVSLEGNMVNSDLVCRVAVGLLGDMAAMFPGGEFKQAYTQPWMTEFIKKTRANPAFLPATKDAARWARDQQKRQLEL